MPLSIFAKLEDTLLFHAVIITGCQKQQDQSQSSKHQVFKHRSVSQTNQLTRQHVLYEMAGRCRLEFPVPQTQTSGHFSETNTEKEKWSHACACQKDYLFTQSVTVCSMYIDDPSLCIYKSVQVWYSYSHSGFFFFCFCLMKLIAIFL